MTQAPRHPRTPNAPLFQRATAPAKWGAQPLLAEACEHGACTQRQAEAVWLRVVCGLPLIDVAHALATTSSGAQRYLDRARARGVYSAELAAPMRWFVAATAGADWQEYGALAEECEQYGLTEKQAACVLYSRAMGLPPKQVAEKAHVNRDSVGALLAGAQKRVRRGLLAARKGAGAGRRARSSGRGGRLGQPSAAMRRSGSSITGCRGQRQ